MEFTLWNREGRMNVVVAFGECFSVSADNRIGAVGPGIYLSPGKSGIHFHPAKADHKPRVPKTEQIGENPPADVNRMPHGLRPNPDSRGSAQFFQRVKARLFSAQEHVGIAMLGG